MSRTYDWNRFDALMRERVRAELDCLHVIERLGQPSNRPERAGARWAHCPSPEHEDRNPSCQVKATRFRCFSCGAQGDVFNLLGLIEAGPSFRDQMQLALTLLGVDIEAERCAFMDRERRELPHPLPSPSEKATTPTCGELHRLPSAPPHAEPVRSSLELWGRVVCNLVLEQEEALYLERERGLDEGLAQAVSLKSCDADTWRELLMDLAAEYTVEECLASGLYLTRSGEPAPRHISDLRVHPWSQRLLLIPYGVAGRIMGLRFRQMGEARAYEGARYLGLIGASNQISTPYLGDERGIAQLPLMGRRRLLYLCEGELDALSLIACGRHALGMAGAHTWRAAWATHWHERYSRVILFEDDDPASTQAVPAWRAGILQSLTELHGAEWVARCVHRTSARGYPDCKDANDLLSRGYLEAHLENFEMAL